MKISMSNIHRFLFFKLPAAYFCGVRVLEISDSGCITTVRHRWINQNPFRSMYFAVQAMAAELSTGVLVMGEIQEANQKISMLVLNSKANYSKKATGRIKFVCNDRTLVKNTIQTAIATNTAQTIWTKSIGTNENGEQVSEMDFEWTIKMNQK